MLNTLDKTALDTDDFLRSVEKFLPLSSPVAVAVSGGPDSMALTFCIKRAGYPCIALIVDHSLRAESAQEAAQVKITLETLGIRAEILSWEHQAVSGALHEKARKARYDLLIEACHRLGAKDLMTAHHRDDQAETILMRLAKGSAVEGLAGIAPQSMRDDIRILRPFLNIAKSRLVATCQTHDIPFVTDPSNTSDKFARGRLRQIMPLLAQEGLTVDSLLRLGTRASEAAEALSQSVTVFLREAAQVEIGGSITLDRKLISTQPRAIALRALVACLRHISLDDYPPEQDGLSDVYNVITETKIDTVRSFYGCLISISETRIVILREPSAATESIPLRAGQKILWDGRWIISAPDTLTPGIIKALGSPPHDVIDRLAPQLRQRIPQGRVRASLPALWATDPGGGESLIAIPDFIEKQGLFATYAKQVFP